MSRKEILLGLAVALALRLGFGAHSFDGKRLFGSLDFEILAANLLEHGVYSMAPPTPTAGREPGYPLFIAGLYGVSGGSPWSVLAGQALLSAATVYLISCLAALVFDQWAGRFAFWLSCFYPYFIYYSAYFFRETLLAFLLAGVFLVLIRSGAREGGGLGAAAGAGGLAGWICLTNGAQSLAVAAVAAAAALEPRPAGAAGGRRWKRALVFLLPVAGMVGLWVGRNLVVMGAFIPASSLVGEQMYWALRVPYEALGTEEEFRLMGREGDDTEFQRLAHLPEVEGNKAFQRAAFRLIKERPAAYLRDCAGRFLGIWRIVPRDRNYTHKYSLVRLLALLSDGWILPLALLGLALGRRSHWVRGMAAFVFAMTMTYSVSQAPIRYRVPAMSLVLVLAAGGASGLRRLAAGRSAGLPS
ncbi:MAG: glycosyltransferase family 39 protein [Elusimicrobia bacterium]|nr:glycosyltransferase family 39 protein [Elusimicrobiota bacterium]